jgi:hypothetical protein
MGVRNFLSGALLGIVLTTFLVGHHYNNKIEECIADIAEHEKAAAALKVKHAKQLEEAWNYALEECPQLFTDYMAIQDENLELKQALLNATIKCEWMIRDAENERTDTRE